MKKSLMSISMLVVSISMIAMFLCSFIASKEQTIIFVSIQEY